MGGISRYDPTSGGYGRGVEGMLVLTELRLLFLPDISSGSASTSFLEFHTVQVRLSSGVGLVVSCCLLLSCCLSPLAVVGWSGASPSLCILPDFLHDRPYSTGRFMPRTHRYSFALRF